MSAKKAKKASEGKVGFFRPVTRRPVTNDDGHVRAPRRWMRLIDERACLVFFYKVWAFAGYGSLNTKVVHRWPPKSVLRRTGVRG